MCSKFRFEPSSCILCVPAMLSHKLKLKYLFFFPLFFRCPREMLPETSAQLCVFCCKASGESVPVSFVFCAPMSSNLLTCLASLPLTKLSPPFCHFFLSLPDWWLIWTRLLCVYWQRMKGWRLSPQTSGTG